MICSSQLPHCKGLGSRKAAYYCTEDSGWELNLDSMQWKLSFCLGRICLKRVQRYLKMIMIQQKLQSMQKKKKRLGKHWLPLQENFYDESLRVFELFLYYGPQGFTEACWLSFKSLHNERWRLFPTKWFLYRRECLGGWKLEKYLNIL